ncbi:MFS transporter [Sphaerisporangium rufum]|uniref:MFS transporter n=1 Tax=Sphaerisporangium rufum TaxID=1381558 RepID=A0A919R7J5_9ACTN|nr:MFS transporter [Sphaerisporangium rufum]GII80648.1 MFS transporter [Sphaerisporangium rufum]
MLTLRRDRPGVVLAVLLAGQTMASMDGSIITVALPSMQREFAAGGAAVQLIVSTYLLTVGLLIVTGARLGDVLGHRRAFQYGLAGFTTASLLCGLAPSVPALVAARVAQAAAAALMMPQVFSLIQLRFTGAARGRAIGLYSMVLALGVALGQLVGGLVVGADLFGLSWRPGFLVNVPVGAVLLAAGARVLPPGAPHARRLDIGGVVLLTVAMTALIGPPIFGREHGFGPWTWASLAAGLLLLVVFARFEGRVARRGGTPLLDLSVLRPPGVRPALVTCFTVMGCYAGLLFALTLHLQDRLGYGPLGSGLAFAPYALGFAALSLTWSRRSARVQALLPVAGPAVFAVTALAVAWLARDGWPVAATAPLLFAAGAGHAAGYGPMIARVSAVAGPERASALSALNSTGPTLAEVAAIAALGGLYLSAGLLWTCAVIAALLAAAGAAAARAHAAFRTPAAVPEPAPAR